MSTTTVTPTPAPAVSVGQEIKNFFSKIGAELEEIGTDALKMIGVIQKDITPIEPELLATLQTMFPNAKIPTATITKIINTTLSTANTVASALQSEGLNPTLDQTAAIQVAAAIHSLQSTPAAALPATSS